MAAIVCAVDGSPPPELFGCRPCVHAQAGRLHLELAAELVEHREGVRAVSRMGQRVLEHRVEPEPAREGRAGGANGQPHRTRFTGSLRASLVRTARRPVAAVPAVPRLGGREVIDRMHDWADAPAATVAHRFAGALAVTCC